MKTNEENFNDHLPAGYDGHFEWDCFKEAGCWKDTKIEPMDIDGVVERGHHYLIFETKGIGKESPLGQKITLDNLRSAKSFTVFNLWPKAPPFEKMEIVYKDGKKEIISGHNNIIERVKQWFEWADKDYWKQKFTEKG